MDPKFRNVNEAHGKLQCFQHFQLLNDEENRVVKIQNHELNEQLALINQLDDDENNDLVWIINSLLTRKRMKDLLDGNKTGGVSKKL